MCSFDLSQIVPVVGAVISRAPTKLMMPRTIIDFEKVAILCHSMNWIMFGRATKEAVTSAKVPQQRSEAKIARYASGP